MKTTQKIGILILLAVLGISTSIKAGNNDETEVRNVNNFNAIDVSTGIDLYISMGSSEGLKVVANEDIIDQLITEVKGNVLRIYMKQDNKWFNRKKTNQTKKVYVTVKELNAIEASSGSDVESENTLKGEQIDIEASSGSDVVLDLIYKEVKLSTSSGSDAKLSGKAKRFEAQASSGSDISAKNLEAKYCRVRVSSGSDAYVNVTEKLYAKATSGGDVYYTGNPGLKEIKESSGGDVKER